MSDLLVRLPLCLFVSVVNVPYEIPLLLEYLQHPIRKHYLVRNLPFDITNHLTVMRKYIFIISENIHRLCYIGLVQMGPQKLKEKDQVFIYLNRNATLFDTTPSDIGYNHISTNYKYEQLDYNFRTMEDVEQYWYDLWSFAMNTNLGCRNSMTGQAIVIESVNTKKALVASTKPRTTCEAKEADVGYIPGDKLGAAGLDSDMFVHLKRNWYWPSGGKEDGPDATPKNTILYPPLGLKRTLTKTRKRVRTEDVKSANSTTNSDAKGKGSSKVRVSPKKKMKKSHVEVIKINSFKEPWKKRSKAKKITRIMKPKRSKYGCKPYYDQKDKEALRRMVKLRVDWSPQEDNLLLLCKVASLYMCPNKRRHLVRNFCAVREILHTTFPETSRNKTSRACQRRMFYMMKNPSTVHSVYVCLEEIKLDNEITAKFGKAVEELDAMLKAQGKGLKGFQKEYDEIFCNLVTTLMRKLKTVERRDKSGLVNITIPDTKQEFYTQFNVIVPCSVHSQKNIINEVQNIVDIICSVVNSVIHSSLCCTNDKTSYSYQLFHIYQQYPDRLLRSVMAKCRSMSIVSCRRRYKRWKTTNHGCLPLSSSPYQLSVAYVNILQTKYQYPIFSECYCALNSIVAKLEALEPDRISDGATENISGIEESEAPQSTSENVQTKNVNGSDGPIELEISNGGECANVVELYSAGFVKMYIEFPEHLIILDPRLSENEGNYSQVMERFKELIALITDKSPKDTQKTNELKKEDDEDFDDEEDGSNEEQNSKTVTKKDSDNEEFNLSNKTGVAKAASRLAVYMMRDEPLESLDKSLQHAHDYFVLNPCKISLKLLNKQAALATVVDLIKKEEILNTLKRMAVFPETHVGNEEMVEIIGQKFPSVNSSLLKQFAEFLEGKKELGASFLDIEDNFGNSQDIQRILHALVDNQLILQSGTVSVRFIHNKCTKPWLIRSYYIPRLVRESMAMASAQAVAFSDMIPEKKMKSDKELNNKEEDQDPNRDPESEKMDVSADNQELEPEIGPTGELGEPETMVEEETKKPDDELVQDDEIKEGDTESNKVLIKRRKRKFVDISKGNMEKFNELDYNQMKSVHVVIRPWIKIDGTLNRRVLDRLLGSILGHCLSVPGVTMEKLQQRFLPALQPVHTLELVKILEKIGCVHVMAIKFYKKPSLFSNRCEASIALSTGFESLSSTVIEPDLLAISKLGQFIGEKAYKVDYLDSLSDSKS